MLVLFSILIYIKTENEMQIICKYRCAMYFSLVKVSFETTYTGKRAVHFAFFFFSTRDVLSVAISGPMTWKGCRTCNLLPFSNGSFLFHDSSLFLA